MLEKFIPLMEVRNGSNNRWIAVSPRSRRRKRNQKAAPKRSKRKYVRKQQTIETKPDLLVNTQQQQEKQEIKPNKSLNDLKTNHFKQTIESQSNLNDVIGDEVLLCTPKAPPKNVVISNPSTGAEPKPSYSQVTAGINSPHVSFASYNDEFELNQQKKKYRKTPRRTLFNKIDISDLSNPVILKNDDFVPRRPISLRDKARFNNDLIVALPNPLQKQPTARLNAMETEYITDEIKSSYQIKQLSNMIQKCNDMGSIIATHRKRMELFNQEQFRFQETFEKQFYDLQVHCLDEERQSESYKLQLANETNKREQLLHKMDQMADVCDSTTNLIETLVGSSNQLLNHSSSGTNAIQFPKLELPANRHSSSLKALQSSNVDFVKFFFAIYKHNANFNESFCFTSRPTESSKSI